MRARVAARAEQFRPKARRVRRRDRLDCVVARQISAVVLTHDCVDLQCSTASRKDAKRNAASHSNSTQSPNRMGFWNHVPRAQLHRACHPSATCGQRTNEPVSALERHRIHRRGRHDRYSSRPAHARRELVSAGRGTPLGMGAPSCLHRATVRSPIYPSAARSTGAPCDMVSIPHIIIAPFVPAAHRE